MPRPRPAPDTFKTSLVRPPDFDAFWADILKQADAIPLNASMELVPHRSTDEVEVFEIGYDSLDGVRIAGWYCRPRETFLAGPYPGLLLVPGYISEPTLPKSWAKLGYAAVGVAPRGKLRSNSQFNPGYPGLLLHNPTDRNTYAYRGFYVDAVRALDFIKSRPEVDTERIGVHGSSQGGALTIVVSALRAGEIAAAAAGAPYLCAIMDSAKLSHTYPYEEINEYLRLYPEREQAMTDTVAYFDVVNMAPLVKCPTLVYIGLVDDCVPPETGYALRDALTAPTEFHATENCAHDAGVYWMMPRVTAFLAEHLMPAATGRRAEQTVG
ncbi:MAG: acetylxylan esterase [Chloroflexota bacterium]